jgi:amino acid adenylation domain-containing protein
MTVLPLLSELRQLGISLALEDGQLRVRAPRGAMSPELQGRVRAQKAVLVDLLRSTAATAAPAIPVSIPTHDPHEASALSAAQYRLWFLAQMQQGDASLNLPFPFRISGALNRDILAWVVREIGERHDVLRSAIVLHGDTPMQMLSDNALELRIVDLSMIASSEREQAALVHAATTASEPFDLATAPLIRFSLYPLADDDHLLLIVGNHLTFDGWSHDVLLREIRELYEARLRGGELPPAPPVRFADYVRWHSAWLDEPAQAQQLAHWTEHLAGMPTVLELPTDLTRPPVVTRTAITRPFTVGEDQMQALRDIAQQSGATFSMLALASLEVLLWRFTGQKDFGIGMPVRGRMRSEAEQMIGMFVNTLVIRSDVGGAVTFRDLLAAVRERSIDALTNQDLPFERIVQALQPARELNRTPLFQVLYSYQEASRREYRMGDLTLEQLPLFSGATGTDATFWIRDHGATAVGVVELSADVFTEVAASRWLRSWQQLLASIIANPDAPLTDLEVLAAEDRDTLLAPQASNTVAYESALVHRVFERQAARSPDRIALRFEEDAITFAALNDRANQLAHELVLRGVGPDRLVGVCLHRSIEMVVAMLAILKAGGGYLPLDPSYPRERLQYFLDDSQATLLITTSSVAQTLALNANRLELDRDAAQIAAHPATTVEAAHTPAQLAYVIYTSGSTGRPKGVMVEHRNVSNFFAAMREAVGLDEHGVWLAGTSTSFDISVLELWGCLCHGRSVVLLGDMVLGDARDTRYGVAALAERFGVTHFQCTPSQSRLLLANPGARRMLASLRQLIVGGEPVPQDLGDALADVVPGEVINGYGPTEVTVYSTMARIHRGERITIGTGVANTQTFILDDAQHLVPAGTTGELYLGGPSVTRGYLHKPELTTERFIANPFAPLGGERLYRTGDLVQLSGAGTLLYRGRNDDQIKIRGYRVELGEIESALRGIAHVEQAVVVSRGSAEHVRLIAYVRVTDAAVTDAILRDAMHRVLPDYMVPATIVLLDRFPLSPNGKVDKQALPEPGGDASAVAFIEPRDDIERQLCAMWSRILAVPRVGLSDNFFSLGGHSLLAVRIFNEIHAAFGARLPLAALFDGPTVAQLSERVRAVRGGPSTDAMTAIGALPHNDPAPLLAAQQRLWFLEQMSPEAAMHNLSFTARLGGALNLRALETAITALGERHDILLSAITPDGDVPQQVRRDVALTVDVIDLTAYPHADRELRIHTRRAAEIERPFNLAVAPLMRFFLFRLSEQEHVLVFVTSHVVFDGWSFGVLWRDLDALYQAFHNNRAMPSGPATRYADFARWHQRWLTEPAQATQLAEWTSALSGMPQVLELATDFPRPAELSNRGVLASFELPAPTVRQLRQLAAAHGVTMHMLALASIEVLLSRYSGQTDFGLGTPVHGRVRAEADDIVGMFVNTLVVRSDVRHAHTFRDLLQRVRNTSLHAVSHQDLPFERLVQALHPARDRTRTPLYQAMFTYEERERHQYNFADLHLAEIPSQSNLVGTDASFWLSEGADVALIEVGLSADLFTRDTANRWLRSWLTILGAVATNPDVALSAIPVIADADLQLLLAPQIANCAPVHDELVHRKFEAMAAQHPDRAALYFEDQRLSFRELDARANQIAHVLVASGVRAETPVGVCLPRGFDLIAAMLGVLKAGGGYLPLDPTYPRDRLNFFVSDSAAPLVITSRALVNEIAFDTDVLLVDDHASVIASQPTDSCGGDHSPEQLAYIIYTSGSTGRPKGVMVEHRNVSSFFVAMRKAIGIDSDGVWMAASSTSFDMSIPEIWGCLCHGRSVVIAGELVLGDARDNTFSLAAQARRYSVTHFQCTPSQARMLLLTDESRGMLERLEQLVLGGEPLPQDLGDTLARTVAGTLINGYGPTEVTVYSTMAPVREGERITIGRGVTNVTTFILDAEQRLVPPGAVGELCLGGPSVTRGYLNRPELTAERFIANPYAPIGGERLYRSGDLVRLDAAGNLAYMGRNDDQVKIRGYRVELGEIETALRAADGVKNAAVIAYGPHDDRRLIGYLVTAKGFPGERELRVALRMSLPDFMVPATFVQLNEFPSLPSGKVDRKALPVPSRDMAAHEYVAAVDDIDVQMCAIWSRILDVERVGLTDDFFALGGHSLIAVRIFNEIYSAFGVRLPLSALFDGPTTGQLAARVRALLTSEGLGGDDGWNTVVPIRPSGTRAPFFCAAGVGGNPMNLVYLSSHMDPDRPFYGLQYRGVDGKRAPHTTIRDMAIEFVQDIRRVQPHGPYFLGGYSMGGVVVYEIAQLLKEQGERTGLVVFLDTYAPTLPSWTRWERVAAHVARLRSEGPRYLVQRYKDRKSRNAWQKAKEETLAGTDEFAMRNEAVERACLIAYNAYEPAAYDGHVLLLQSRVRLGPSDGIGQRTHESNGWRQYVRSAIDVIIVAQRHLDIVTPAAAPETARLISDAIERADPDLTAGTRQSTAG